MCKSMWGEDDPSIHYGLTCKSGPLGGDAQIAALMCMEDLGGIIFFVDPLSAHPHQVDIDSLLRLANCGNIIVCANPTSASTFMNTLRTALLNEEVARDMIPSFFETLESPAVEEYKHQQAMALAKVIKETPSSEYASKSCLSSSAAETDAPRKGEKATMEQSKQVLVLGSEEDDNDKEKGSKSGQKQRWRKKKLAAVEERPALSDSLVHRALMGQSLVIRDSDFQGEALRSLLMGECNNEDESSKGLYGINKTRSSLLRKENGRIGIKKRLGEGMRMMLKH